jgi:hypothetical protein
VQRDIWRPMSQKDLRFMTTHLFSRNQIYLIQKWVSKTKHRDTIEEPVHVRDEGILSMMMVKGLKYTYFTSQSEDKISSEELVKNFLEFFLKWNWILWMKVLKKDKKHGEVRNESGKYTE